MNEIEKEIMKDNNNSDCKDSLFDDMGMFDDIEIKANQLGKYFVVLSGEQGPDKFKTRWKEYHMNPLSSGIMVRIGQDTLINYDFTKVCLITITESCGVEYGKNISFFDKNNQWLQDIDIETNKSLDDITFIFERTDLEYATTKNTDRQIYIELHENLNPYASIDECKEIVEKWVKEHMEYLDGKCVVQETTVK